MNDSQSQIFTMKEVYQWNEELTNLNEEIIKLKEKANFLQKRVNAAAILIEEARKEGRKI